MSNLHFSSQILVKIVVKISSQISSNCFRKPPSIGNFRFLKNSDSIQSVRFNPISIHSVRFNPISIHSVRFESIFSCQFQGYGSETNPFDSIRFQSIRSDSIRFSPLGPIRIHFLCQSLTIWSIPLTFWSISSQKFQVNFHVNFNPESDH